MRLIAVNSKKPTQKTYVWTMSGNQGNTWKMATVDLGQLPAGYKVCHMVLSHDLVTCSCLTRLSGIQIPTLTEIIILFAKVLKCMAKFFITFATC